MPSMDGRHAVVILNYRGRADTLACVESVTAGSPAAAVLVVDNGSGDGTPEAVRQRWADDVGVLELPSNLGFTGGMNAGIEWALSAGASCITVLNNDTTVERGALDRLAAHASGRCIVSPVIRYLDKPSSVWFGAGAIDRDTGLARHLSEQEVAETFPAQGPRSVEVLTGCCLTASAASWRELGGFDPWYFLNFEDSELSMRARGRGFDLVVLPEAVIHHRVSASFVGPAAHLASYYYARNGLRFVGRVLHRDLRTRARFARARLLPQVFAALRRRAVREALTTSVMVGAGALHAVTGQGGRAPSWLERLAGAGARSAVRVPGRAPGETTGRPGHRRPASPTGQMTDAGP